MSCSSWLKWLLCFASVWAGDAEGMEGQYWGVEQQERGQDNIFYILGDSALLRGLQRV